MNRVLLPGLVLMACAACTGAGGGATSSSSSSSSSSGASSSSSMMMTSSSASSSSSGAAPVMEMEPNGGGTATEVNTGMVPGAYAGVVDPADDMDILAFELQAGTLVRWELSTPGGVMAPHLGLSQEGNNVPTMVARGGAGAAVVQEHFVLEGGRYFAILRDARNVPAASSAHEGSAQHAWRLDVTTPARMHRAATLPSTQEGTLATPTSVDTWQFTASAGTAFDIVLNAQRRMPASDMDSRMSLFHVETADWIITNDDDVEENTLDSHVGGMLPAAGTYVVVVENIAEAPARLDYQLVFSLR